MPRYADEITYLKPAKFDALVRALARFNNRDNCRASFVALIHIYGIARKSTYASICRRAADAQSTCLASLHILAGQAS